MKTFFSFLKSMFADIKEFFSLLNPFKKKKSIQNIASDRPKDRINELGSILTDVHIAQIKNEIKKQRSKKKKSIKKAKKVTKKKVRK